MTLHLPAREIPVPGHLSPAAQGVLGMKMPAEEGYPALDDLAGWRALVARREAALLPMIEALAGDVAADDEQLDVDGVVVHAITPHGLAAGDRRVYLEIHGGALITGGGPTCRVMGLLGVPRVQGRIWAVDYRMPPDHPYPAGLDDCLTVYRALLADHRPEDVVVGGSSAGGNLAAALVLRARDEGLPMPAAVVLGTPEVDLTESGDTFATNLGVDTMLRPLLPVNLLYAGGEDLAHPYLSPLFGDFTRGFPPTILTTGTRDLFLSNTVRMHRALRAAGVPAELHVLEAGPHGGFWGQAPEDAEIAAEVQRFLAAHWGR
jgi:acetyl esterase/lipase